MLGPFRFHQLAQIQIHALHFQGKDTQVSTMVAIHWELLRNKTFEIIDNPKT